VVLFSFDDDYFIKMHMIMMFLVVFNNPSDLCAYYFDLDADSWL